jgi:hypothetical protein
LVAEYPDAKLWELCKLLANQSGNWVSRTALYRPKQKLGLNRKKKAGTVAKPPQKESSMGDKLKDIQNANLFFDQEPCPVSMNPYVPEWMSHPT